MTPERRREAEQAGEAYHAALAALGIAAFDEILSLWLSLPESQAQTAVNRWVDSVTTATSVHRRQARALTVSYYRLIRALRTGMTIVDPATPRGDGTTLSDLRSDFSSHIRDIPRSPNFKPAQEAGDDVVIEEDVDLIDEVEDELDSIQAQADFLLADLVDYRRKLDRARNARERRKVESDAKALAASSGQKGAMDGGRAVLHDVGAADRKAIGFVRLSRTGDPCAFCRMLMSRGRILYSSYGGSTFRKSDGEKYHTNCQCYGEPIFSMDEYENDPRFALNRELSALWAKVTEGHTGRDALNAWRRYWYQRSETVNPDLNKKPRAPAA